MFPTSQLQLQNPTCQPIMIFNCSESNALPSSQARSISSAMSYSKRLSLSSRPESVIERLRIESSDDGRGPGITIGGTFISANCSIILVVMASIFMVVGAILTAISYR